jgi:hypothetical protein
MNDIFCFFLKKKNLAGGGDMKSEDMGSYSKSCIEVVKFCMFWPMCHSSEFCS